VGHQHTGRTQLRERTVGRLAIATDGDGTRVTYLGPSLFKRLAARANPTGGHFRRIFLGVRGEGRPMSDLDMAVLAEVVTRDPGAWRRAMNAWLDGTERPSRIDYQKAWSSEAAPAPLSDHADEIAAQYACERRAAEWTRVATAREPGRVKPSLACGARRGSPRPRARGRRFRRVGSRSGSRGDPGLADDPEPPGAYPCDGWRSAQRAVRTARSCDEASLCAMVGLEGWERSGAVARGDSGSDGEPPGAPHAGVGS
jgi:hypothetical protein